MKTIARPFTNLLAIVTVALITLSSSASIFALDPGVFELDGNAVTNHSGTALPDDWDRINPGPGSNAAVSAFTVDPAGASIFTGGGSKDVLDISQWKYTTGSVPDKDEITDAYAAAYTNAAGEVLLYFGADRFDNSGDSQIGFWFFQNQVSLNPMTGNSGTFSGIHAKGDILILSDFTNGGAIGTIRIFEWVGSGGSDGPLNLLASGSDASNAGPDALLDAIVNSSPQTAPWAYKPKSGAVNIFPTGTFFEGGANLSKLLPSLECFTSFLVETRSSQSVTATLKDFVLGNFAFAPKVSVGSRTICKGTTTTLTATVTGGLGSPTFSWTGPNGFTATTQQINVSVAGTYTVTVSTSFGCRVSASGVLTVNPTPSATISPPNAQICAGGTQTFTVTPTGGTAPYTIAWTGPNGFTASTASITVATTGTYTANITDAKGCTTSAMATLVVNPTPQVTIVGSTGCQTVPASLIATVTSGTGTLHYSWTGPGGFTSTAQTISISTGGTYTVQVTDANGCHGSASRVVGLCLQ